MTDTPGAWFAPGCCSAKRTPAKIVTEVIIILMITIMINDNDNDNNNNNSNDNNNERRPRGLVNSQR